MDVQHSFIVVQQYSSRMRVDQIRFRYSRYKLLFRLLWTPLVVCGLVPNSCFQLPQQNLTVVEGVLQPGCYLQRCLMLHGDPSNSLSVGERVTWWKVEVGGSRVQTGSGKSVLEALRKMCGLCNLIL